MKSRLKQFIKEIGISQRFFEEKCGLCNGYVNSIRESMGAQKLENVLKAFPELNREWLLYGTGEMLNTGHVHHNSITIDASGDTATASGDNSVALAGKAQYTAAGDREIVSRLHEEIAQLKAQLAIKDEQIASLHGIIAALTSNK